MSAEIPMPLADLGDLVWARNFLRGATPWQRGRVVALRYVPTGEGVWNYDVLLLDSGVLVVRDDHSISTSATPEVLH